MNDSLTLDRSVRTRRGRSASTGPLQFGTSTLGGVVPLTAEIAALRQAAADRPARATPVEIVLERLGAGAPALLAHADRTTKSRLAELVIKRLGSMVRDATTAFCLHVGEVAAAACRADATRLQDAALAIRPRADDLVAEAAHALSPAQLLALLAAASHDHDPEGIDALRCRHLVTSGVDALAREAMLDLATAAETSTIAVERAVASHMVRLLASSGLLPAALLAALSQSDQELRPAHAGPRRLEDDGAPQAPLLRALARGDHEAAVPLLASAAGVSVETVRTAIFLRTSKGLLSLGWRAGLDAADAAALQDTLGRLPPEETLRPTENGEFPLTGPEMLWQCRFLAGSQHSFGTR